MPHSLATCGAMEYFITARNNQTPDNICWDLVFSHTSATFYKRSYQYVQRSYQITTIPHRLHTTPKTRMLKKRTKRIYLSSINVQSQCMGIVLRYIQRLSGGGIAGRTFPCITGRCGQCRRASIRWLGGAWPVIHDTYAHNRAR